MVSLFVALIISQIAIGDRTVTVPSVDAYMALSAEVAELEQQLSTLKDKVDAIKPSKGMPANYSATNPRIQADKYWQPAVRWNITSDATNVAPSFSTIQNHANELIVTNGLNQVHGAAKTTFTTQANVLEGIGQGQRIVESSLLNAVGNGDAILADRTINYAGGLADGGGEGIKFDRAVVDQWHYVVKRRVDFVLRCELDTTLQTALAPSIEPQRIWLATTEGCKVGDWITIDSGPPASVAYSRSEVCKVLAIDGNTITARVSDGHEYGAKVKGSQVLVFQTGSGFGQGRYAVNLSSAPINSGRAKATSLTQTNGVSGEGVDWSRVQPNSVLSFDADRVTQPPFDASNPLHVWYPIASVGSDTLNLYRRDQVGIAPYSGNAREFGGYQIRPAARVMATDPLSNRHYSQVVLEANDFEWNAGDMIECAHSSSMDVAGATWRFKAYSPGQTLRTGLEISNAGLQDFECGVSVGSYGNSAGWKIGAQFGAKDIGLSISMRDAKGTAINLDTYSEKPGRIQWGSSTTSIGYDHANRGLRLQATHGGAGAGNGVLQFTTPEIYGTNSTMKWGGNIVAQSMNQTPTQFTLGIAGGAMIHIEADNEGLILKKTVGTTTTTIGRVQVQ